MLLLLLVVVRLTRTWHNHTYSVVSAAAAAFLGVAAFFGVALGVAFLVAGVFLVAVAFLAGVVGLAGPLVTRPDLVLLSTVSTGTMAGACSDV